MEQEEKKKSISPVRQWSQVQEKFFFFSLFLLNCGSLAIPDTGDFFKVIEKFVNKM